ncbi:MAG: PHP-associated domain-containing protein [Halovenus sp.]
MTDSGRVRVDFHVKILDETVVERAKSRGLDVLVYAPHFTRLPSIERRAERFSDDDLTVVPAREVFTGPWYDRRHLLAFGLTDPIPDFITLAGAMAELDRQDATVLVPHPEFLTVSLDRAQIDRYHDLIDGVEAYNPKHLPWHNERARTIARETDLPAFTSSYAHLRETIGEAWTTAEGPIEDAIDLSRAIREDELRVYHRTGFGHRLRCLAEFAHLGYENTWEKFDRVVRGGMEPTHPGHVAYGGRFDDVRVDHDGVLG